MTAVVTIRTFFFLIEFLSRNLEVLTNSARASVRGMVLLTFGFILFLMQRLKQVCYRDCRPEQLSLELWG